MPQQFGRLRERLTPGSSSPKTTFPASSLRRGSFLIRFTVASGPRVVFHYTIDESCSLAVVPGENSVLLPNYADNNGDDNVNINDLLFILSNWGPCP